MEQAEVVLLLVAECGCVTHSPRSWVALTSVCRLVRDARIGNTLECDTYDEARALSRAAPGGPLSRCVVRVKPRLLFPELVHLSSVFARAEAQHALLSLPCHVDALERLERAGAGRARACCVELMLGHCSDWLALTRRALRACPAERLHALDGARWSLNSCAAASDTLEDVIGHICVAVAVPPCRDAAAAVAEVLVPRAGRLRIESLRLWPDAHAPGLLADELRGALGHDAPRVLQDRVPTRF